MEHLGLGAQTGLLFLLALAIACVSWTVTHEEVFREPREYCVKRSKNCQSLLARKFFYLFTCEYCFSHWVTAAFLVLTRYHLWLPDWRGYVLAEFALVWVANVYMGAYVELRLEIKHDRQIIEATEQEMKENGEDEPPQTQSQPIHIQRKAGS
jgi:hypothetical protein